jgi:nitrate/nitrite-specific signal transduction histidine kinase
MLGAIGQVRRGDFKEGDPRAGVGLNPAILESSKSMGLFGMRERARQCNGILDLELNIPTGTSIKVFVPSVNIIADEDINS